MDVSYLKINDILEYNLPYMQSDFTCNPGPTIKSIPVVYKVVHKDQLTNTQSSLSTVYAFNQYLQSIGTYLLYQLSIPTSLPARYPHLLS